MAATVIRYWMTIDLTFDPHLTFGRELLFNEDIRPTSRMPQSLLQIVLNLRKIYFKLLSINSLPNGWSADEKLYCILKQLHFLAIETRHSFRAGNEGTARRIVNFLESCLKLMDKKIVFINPEIWREWHKILHAGIFVEINLTKAYINSQAH